MTLIAARNASEEQITSLTALFNEMGRSMLIEEKQFAAATSLTSCGIAYVLKYVQAAMQAGVELGIKPHDAQTMLAQTLEGAAKLLLNNENAHPATEIEKVTTPGGITIKGINSLEHDGFTSAVIHAIKANPCIAGSGCTGFVWHRSRCIPVRHFRNHLRSRQEEQAVSALVGHCTYHRHYLHHPVLFLPDSIGHVAFTSQNLFSPIFRPFQAVPSFHKDKGTDVLVEQEGTPHADQSPAQMNTEQIAESDRDRPLHNQTDIEREIHDNENGHSQPDNILVVRQHTEDCMTEYGPDARKSQRN